MPISLGDQTQHKRKTSTNESGHNGIQDTIDTDGQPSIKKIRQTLLTIILVCTNSFQISIL